MEGLKCANCANYPLKKIFQLSCGDRFCEDCMVALKCKAGNSRCTDCPHCKKNITLESHRDKAAERELKIAMIKCTNQDCPWEGLGQYYKDHIESCEFTKISCPNKFCGCPRQLLKNQLSQHLRKGCCFSGVKCPRCSKKVQNIDFHTCRYFAIPRPKGCGKKMTNKSVTKHKCIQMKDHDTGCHEFKGYDIKDLERIIRELITAVKQQMEYFDQLQSKVQVFIDAEGIQQLQDDFKEMVLMMQTLQATSYNGTFIWKIPEVHRRRREARSGRTVSLYSAPFYTNRHGYKMCLRLYMDGDGSGKGTHLSLFLTLMRGEYDALLTWPFRQIVTLVLLDQDRQKDIFQSFRPDPSSSSFQQPINEMNVASGCPKFAPLSILENPSYVKNDTMYLKVDTNPPSICRFARLEPSSL